MWFGVCMSGCGVFFSSIRFKYKLIVTAIQQVRQRQQRCRRAASDVARRLLQQLQLNCVGRRCRCRCSSRCSCSGGVGAGIVVVLLLLLLLPLPEQLLVQIVWRRAVRTAQHKRCGTVHRNAVQIQCTVALLQHAATILFHHHASPLGACILKPDLQGKQSMFSLESILRIA